MKNKIVTIGLLFAVMAAMTGIAAADPCGSYKADPFNGAWIITDTVVNGLGGETVTYKLGTNNIPGVTVKEVCVFNDDFDLSYPTLTPLWNGPSDLWSIQNKMDQFLFKAGSKTYIPIDGTISTVGIADYLASTQPTVKYNLHIVDKTVNRIYCPTQDPDAPTEPDANTCFLDPTGSPNHQEVPEFSTLAFPIAAVIGLVFFFQHKKR